MKLANLRALATNERRLHRHAAALVALSGQPYQLTQETITHFRLGLSSCQTGSAGIADALTAPLMDCEGHPRARFLRTWLQGVTTGPPHASEWVAGVPNTYWVTPARGRLNLVICGSVQEGWRLWQAVQGAALADQLCIIASSHGHAIPRDWCTPGFWAAWSTVYAAQEAGEAGDSMADAIREQARRDVRRVRPPGGASWVDALGRSVTLDELTALLQDAPVMTGHVASAPISTLTGGRRGYFDAVPVDPRRAFINGHLYYAFRALEIEEEDGQEAPRWRTLVLRSDGVICRAAYRPARRGTPREDRVLALDDGTLLTKLPQVNPHQMTFKASAIHRFAEARRQQCSALTLTPPQMVALIEQHLRSKVLLPYTCDYTMLTYVVVTSYVQAIFEAVPLVLVTGEPGSGKSELGMAMAQVGCNAVVLNGQTSAASVARTLDSVSGLAILDDLEGIGGRTRSKGEFSELIQQLKVSYKKSTAQKLWTNPKTLQVEELNFFGVKVINNTRGADAILNSRMLTVATRRIPPGVWAAHRRAPPLSAEKQSELRTNLHMFAMECAQEIATLYQEKFSVHTGREEEITAPLRLLAELMGDPEAPGRLTHALQGNAGAATQTQSGVEVLLAAAQELVRQGYRDWVAMPHLELELRRKDGVQETVAAGNVQPYWLEPRWIGRTLRQGGIVDRSRPGIRARLWGHQIRLYPLDRQFVASALEELHRKGAVLSAEQTGPCSYCVGQPCETCRYADVCDTQEHKLIHLRRRGSER